MKQLLLLAFTFFVCLSASAQWSVEFVQEDELKGITPHYFNYYSDPDKQVFLFKSNTLFLMVGMKDGIFNSNGNFVNGLVGFYEGDKLVGKETSTFYVPDEGIAAVLSGEDNRDIILRIFDHIQKKGSVRFVIERYLQSDFDITVPKNPKVIYDKDL